MFPRTTSRGRRPLQDRLTKALRPRPHVEARKRGAEPRPSLRNPSFWWRVTLVAAVWAVPGALAGGMLNLFAPLFSNPMGGFLLGGVVGEVLGGVLEAVYG